MWRQIIAGLLVWIILITSRVAFADELDEYKSFSIHNTSVGIFNSINSQYSSQFNSNSDFLNLIINERDARYTRLFGSPDDVNKYLKTIDNGLVMSKDLQDMQKFFWDSGRFISKYGIDVAFKFTDKLPPNPITNFAAPALQKGAELYADHFFDEKLAEDQTERDKFIKELVERAAAKDPNLLFQTNQTDFERVYNIAQADLTGLKRDDLPAFNRVTIQQAYKYLDEHRTQLQAHSEQLAELTDDLNKKLPDYINGIKGKVDEEFKKLGSSIATLTEKQQEHQQVLESLQQSVGANQQRLDELEKQMISVQGDLTQVKALEQEHSKILAENSLKIDILTGYMFQTLNTDQKLNGLRQGHFDSVFGCHPNSPCPKKDELISGLEKLKTVETIVSVVNTSTAALNAGFDAVMSLRLLKGEDAKRVGLFVRYVSTALQVGAGIARVFAGDLSGIFSVLGGLGGLFGGGSQKSPELQFLEQMYDQMMQQFAAVQQNLQIINDKIDQLGKFLVDMYKSMMNSFQYLSDRLDRLDWKLDVLQEQTRLLLFHDYQTCKTVETARAENNLALKKYSDFGILYNATSATGQCLHGLDDFTNTEDNGYFYLSSYTKLQNLVDPNNYQRTKANVEFQIKKVFEPTRTLFLSRYPNNFNQMAKAALFFPVLDLDNSTEPLFEIDATHTDKLLLGDALDDYINYEMVNQFADLLLTYSPYFEISTGVVSQYSPQSMSSYMALPDISKGVNASVQVFRYKKLLRVTNYALLQQSLIAGNLLIEPTYTILFAANQKTDDIKTVLSILGQNSLFARNFVVYLLHKNLRISEPAIGTAPSPSHYNEFSDLYEKVKKTPDDPELIKSLNKLITLNDFTFKVNSNDKRLYVTIHRQDQDVDILVPEPTEISENRMINTGAAYSLLETRHKLIDRMEEITFTQTLPTAIKDSGFTLDDYKYLYRVPISAN